MIYIITTIAILISWWLVKKVEILKKEFHNLVFEKSNLMSDIFHLRSELRKERDLEQLEWEKRKSTEYALLKRDKKIKELEDIAVFEKVRADKLEVKNEKLEKEKDIQQAENETIQAENIDLEDSLYYEKAFNKKLQASYDHLQKKHGCYKVKH
jgi:hypothetical protein